jgi:DNA (cytosine-5)-methyltransferase 1
LSGESESQPTLVVTGDALLKLTVSLFSPFGAGAMPYLRQRRRNRVCNVPIEPGADWHSLPEELLMATGVRESRTSGQDVRYSRLDGNGHFRTAMTTVTPTASGSTVIHPTVCPYLALYMPEGGGNKLSFCYGQQKRVLTVRECARAQGFPDNWKFLSDSERPSTIVRDVSRIL